jgi:hypothetical protein
MPANRKPNKDAFLFDEATRTVLQSQALEYRAIWYHPGKVVAVAPIHDPEITYLVDIEDNNGQMSCTCDSYMFRPDPRMVAFANVSQEPCRHIRLVRALLKMGVLQA